VAKLESRVSSLEAQLVESSKERKILFSRLDVLESRITKAAAAATSDKMPSALMANEAASLLTSDSPLTRAKNPQSEDKPWLAFLTEPRGCTPAKLSQAIGPGSKVVHA